MYQSETKHLLNRFVVDSALVSSSRSPRHEQIVSTCFQRVGDTVTKESPARKKTPQDSLRSKSGYNPMHVLYGIKPPSNRRIRTSLSRNLDKKKEVRPIKATSCSATPSEIRRSAAIYLEMHLDRAQLRRLTMCDPLAQVLPNLLANLFRWRCQ